MNIPDKVIEAAEYLSVEVRGMLLCAVIEYMKTEKFPDWIEGEAKGAFILAKAVLDPVMRRRRLAKARRERLKARLVKNASEPKVTPIEVSANDAVYVDEPIIPKRISVPPLTRQQRRKLERMKRRA